jgi:hypothetical protein
MNPDFLLTYQTGSPGLGLQFLSPKDQMFSSPDIDSKFRLFAYGLGGGS